MTSAVWHTLGDAIDAFRCAGAMAVERSVALERADELAAAASAALQAHSQARDEADGAKASAPSLDALERLFAAFFESIAPTGNLRPSLADFMVWSRAHIQDDAVPVGRFVGIAASGDGLYAVDLGGQVWSYRDGGWRLLGHERIAGLRLKPEPRPPRLLGTDHERSAAQGIVSVEISAADANVVSRILEFVQGVRATPPLIRDAIQRLGGVRHRLRLSVERIDP